MAQRRKRGTGTIQHDTTRGDYIARTSCRSRSGRFATRKDAEKALAAWNTAIAAGMNLNGARQTVQYFVSVWLAEVAKNRVGPKTYEFYERHLNYCIPHIGTIALSDLTAEHIQRMLNALAEAGLSPRSVAHVRAVLRNALKTAIKWRYVTENAASLADAPHVPEMGDRTLEPTEMAALLAVLPGHRWGVFFETMAILGPRPIELLGLLWADVNLEAATISVVDSKTPSGRRGIPLPPRLAERWLWHWKNQQEERSTLGVEWKEHMLVFPSEVGTPMSEDNLRRTFKKLLKRAKLSADIQIYDLRRTAISWWIETGADPRAAQTLAGHSTPDVTLGIYSRSRLEAQRIVVTEAERRRKQA
jgi:integrase